MADPLRNPLDPSHELEPLGTTSLPASPPDVDEIEPRRIRREREPLTNAAETVGSTVGSAIGTIRDKVQSGIELVKKRSSENSASVEDISGKVRERANDLKREGQVRVQEWTSIAQRRIRDLRAQTQRFSRERPAELILVIGGVAVIAGLILRLWRSSRD